MHLRALAKKQIWILHRERDFQYVIHFAIILSTDAPSVIIGKKQMTNSFNCIIAILISLQIDHDIATL